MPELYCLPLSSQQFEKEVDKLPTGDQPTALAKELNSALQVFYLARFDMVGGEGDPRAKALN